MPRTELTGPTTINVAPTGSDTAGDGSGGNPYKRLQHVLDKLVCDYDLRGQQVIIQMADGVYSDPAVARGRMVGQRSLMQQATMIGQSFEDTVQVTIRGNVSNPAAVLFKPTSGPCLGVENGAAVNIEGVKFDMRDSAWESTVVISAESHLGIGKVIFGPAPGCHEIQVGHHAVCWVFEDYVIDHTGSVNVTVNGAVNNGSATMGLSAPNPAIVAGLNISGPYIQPGTTVVSVSGLYVTMSKPAVGNAGFNAFTFTDVLPPLFHFSLDNFCTMHFCPNFNANMEVTLVNSPAYANAFAYVAGGELVLREGPYVPGVVFKGGVSAPTPAIVTRNGYIYNTPYDNQVIFTP